MSLFPGEETIGSEARLRPADRRFLWLCLAVAAVTLAVGFWLYPKVNPEASIRFEVDRRGAEEVAARFLREVEVDPGSWRHAARFTYDNDAKVFLERTLGLERANELMAGPVRMWRWSHRWFRPLQKEEVSVHISVAGSVAAFEHQIAEESPGASLSADSARAAAERLLAGPLGIDLSRLAFEGLVTQERPARVDHTFTWKRTDLPLGAGDLRYEVRIQGDRPGAFREFVRVPEAWSRDYSRLRSLNESAGLAASALSVLLLLAVLAVLLSRLRGGSLRWRPALTFGGLGAALALLASANSLPVSFYEYETTSSLGGFLSRRILSAAFSALLLGMFIFLVTASGESLYRERYPGKLSLAGVFSRRGLRTRRFLLQSVLGLTLTCFFFCYQEVFYAVALRFGAWAPLEVPYDELLNTALPWAFILLIGFMPAVTEEFAYRLFPIPLLQKYLRSTLLALAVPAFVWGFGHAGYPNQPFYIRGLEVGLAGILVGWVMLRFGILAPLVWHYTVDALYSSTLLFRSGNLYYVVSAALAGGIILLPTLWAAVAYRRTGRFEEPVGLTNAEETASGSWASEGGELPAPEAGTSTPRSPQWPRPTAVAGREPLAAPAVGLRPRLPAILLALGGLLLLLLPGARVGPEGGPSIGRRDALSAARAILPAVGESPDSFRVVVSAGARFDRLEARFLLEQGGAEALRERFRLAPSPLRWKVRFFRPLDPREVTVEIDAVHGSPLSIERHAAEDDSLPSPAPAEAESLARRFIAARGLDLKALVLRESAEEKRPRRTDRTFLFEAREDDPRNAGEARHRVRVVLTGDRVGAWSESLKLPEEWTRSREKETLWTSLGTLTAFLAIGGLLGLLLWQLIGAQRARRVPWRRCLLVASPLVFLSVVRAVNEWPQVLSRYVTAVPWEVFQFTAGLGVGIGVVVNALLFTVSLAVAFSCWPEAARLPAGDRARRPLVWDALLVAAAALALAAGLRHLEAVALRLWPGSALAPIPALPRGSDTFWPWLGLVWASVSRTVLIAGLGAGVLALARTQARSPYAWGLLGLIYLSLAVQDVRTPGELGVGLLVSGLQLGGALLGARLLLRGNLLAWPLTVFVLVSASALAPYLGATGEAYRPQGWIALVLLCLPVVALVFCAGRERKVAS